MDTELRQGQLISPFGIGALHVSSDGTSLITGGLDYWLLPDFTNENFIESEFRIEEPRLQRMLNVDYFLFPPDYRQKDKYATQQVNKEIRIPMFRFPHTYFCQRCGLMRQLRPTDKQVPVCDCEGKKKLVPVPLVAICDHGHAQEFPWSEWAHEKVIPECGSNELYFRDNGTPGLEGLTVECKKCGSKRSLFNATTATSPEKSYLTDSLAESGERYLCRGEKPWLNAKDNSCSRPLRASLRSASNLYFPIVRSAIHIPNSSIPEKLQSLFEQSSELTAVLDLAPNVEIEPLKARFPQLSEFKDLDIKKGIQGYIDAKQDSKKHQNKKISEIQNDLRQEEYEVLGKDCNSNSLSVRKMELKEYGKIVTDNFSTICLIDKLRETRALAGFTRIFPDTEMTTEELQGLMREDSPIKNRKWLPANIVYGEGIFLVLNKGRLDAWENNPLITSRIDRLAKNYAQAQLARKLIPRQFPPRFILLHTLSHLIMNQMIFEAGYSSASLRERLYVSTDSGQEMYGMLIYTAAGDSDGSMGGLVNLGLPGAFEEILSTAIENANWCSADPICMEMSTHGGQGPDNCNLAACHNCSLVPETACEEFNRFLDRGVIIGNEENKNIGYFNY